VKQYQRPDSDRLSNREFEAVLARAAEVDVRLADGVSIKEARAIALQAGISQDAIAAALDDWNVGNQTDLGRREPAPSTVTSVLTGVALGAGVGSLLSLARIYVRGGDAALFILLGLALIPALALALTIAGDNKHRRFQWINLSLWLTTITVWTSVNGPTSEFEDLFIIGGWLGGVGSVLGSAILAIRDMPGRFRGLDQKVRGAFQRDVVEVR
jgi:hypothetical protein